jgi:hypothetical protein
MNSQTSTAATRRPGLYPRCYDLTHPSTSLVALMEEGFGHYDRVAYASWART